MNINKHIIISGISFTIVIIIWPIFMALSHPSGPERLQFDWILDHYFLHGMQFFFALLISPSIIYLMLALSGVFKKPEKLSMRIALIFLGGYLVLSSISYASQIVIIPAWIEKGYFQLTEIWYFGNPHSVAYFLNQLGYLFWAVAAMILFLRLITEKRLMRWIGIFYIASAILTFIAFVGLLIDNPFLNSFTMISGMLLLPVGILSIVMGYRLNSGAIA